MSTLEMPRTVLYGRFQCFNNSTISGAMVLIDAGYQKGASRNAHVRLVSAQLTLHLVGYKFFQHNSSVRQCNS